MRPWTRKNGPGLRRLVALGLSVGALAASAGTAPANAAGAAVAPVAVAPATARLVELATAARDAGFVGLLGTATVPGGTIEGRPADVQVTLAEDAAGKFVLLDTVHEGARALGILEQDAATGDVTLTSWRLSGTGVTGPVVASDATTVMAGGLGDLFSQIVGNLACAALAAGIVALTPLTGGLAFVAGSAIGTTVCWALANIDTPATNPHHVHWAGNSVDPYGAESSYYEMGGSSPYTSLADFEVRAVQCLPQSATNECLQPVAGQIKNVRKTFRIELKWPDNTKQTINYACYCSYFFMMVNHENYVQPGTYSLLLDVEEAMDLIGFTGIGRAHRVYQYVRS